MFCRSMSRMIVLYNLHVQPQPHSAMIVRLMYALLIFVEYHQFWNLHLFVCGCLKNFDCLLSCIFACFDILYFGFSFTSFISY